VFDGGVEITPEILHINITKGITELLNAFI
jgi:hypothetical protein